MLPGPPRQHRTMVVHSPCSSPSSQRFPAFAIGVNRRSPAATARRLCSSAAAATRGAALIGCSSCSSCSIAASPGPSLSRSSQREQGPPQHKAADEPCRPRRSPSRTLRHHARQAAPLAPRPGSEAL
eukprot:7384979-Prymnesium_polylepis.2